MRFVPHTSHRYVGMPTPACVDHPIILMIDRGRQILDSTPAGTALLGQRDLLAGEFGRVTACGQRDAVRLDAAIETAVETGGATLTLNEGALQIEIVRFGGHLDDARLLLICRPQSKNAAQHVEDAALLFGLTSAEHRLLKLLFAGQSLPCAASSLGVARTTARTHLQRIFDKTGSRRQSDLVRLVALGGTERRMHAQAA